MVKEIKKANKEIPVEYVYKAHTKVISLDDDSLNVPFNRVLGKVLKCVNVKEVVENIKKESKYIVDIPVEFKKQI